MLIDANLLIYAFASHLPQHAVTRDWLDRHLGGTAPIGIPWPSLITFARVTSNRKAFRSAAPVVEVWDQVRRWLACSVVWTPAPTARHVEVLAGLLPHTGTDPDLIPDAHLAALAIEHGLAVASADRDFARFPGLRWINPLAA